MRNRIGRHALQKIAVALGHVKHIGDAQLLRKLKFGNIEDAIPDLLDGGRAELAQAGIDDIAGKTACNHKISLFLDLLMETNQQERG